jgi:serine protease Do
MVRTVLEGARTGGPIVRAWLGATGQPVTAEIAQGLSLPHPMGVLVKELVPGSPAAEAGVKVGDVVTAIEGHEVDDPEDLRFRVATLPVDAPARLTLWRKGQQQTVIATVTAPPDDPPRGLAVLEGRQPLAGATVGNLNPAFAEELGLDSAQRGVAVAAVKDGSTAGRLGLEKGDILVSLNAKPLASVTALRDVVAQTKAPWTVAVRRGERVLTVTVRD